MPTTSIPRPGSTEYAPFYERYIGSVPDDAVIARLRAQIEETAALFGSLDDARAGYRYAPGKWSARQIVGHLADAERIFLFRALAIARGESKSLPAFDENAYVENARFDERAMASLVAELRAARASTLAFLEALTDAELARAGVANNNPVTVRAIAYIITGHELAHVQVYRERYLG